MMFCLLPLVLTNWPPLLSPTNGLLWCPMMSRSLVFVAVPRTLYPVPWPQSLAGVTEAATQEVSQASITQSGTTTMLVFTRPLAPVDSDKVTLTTTVGEVRDRSCFGEDRGGTDDVFLGVGCWLLPLLLLLSLSSSSSSLIMFDDVLVTMMMMMIIIMCSQINLAKREDF